jgi:ribulose-5-phosphate 4-epimerase/fuculose-1-phosphate aldolase
MAMHRPLQVPIHDTEHFRGSRCTRLDDVSMAWPLLDPRADEPVIADPAALREHRKERLALAYRLFGAMGWGALGEGHISARDPILEDHFWLARYGAPFARVDVGQLVLVGPTGSVVDGEGWINDAAYNIHAPIHEARPDIVSVAHTHTPYGTPLSARVVPVSPITQEACAFFRDHEIFDDGEVAVVTPDGGKRIAAALGGAKAVLLRNHGTLTVGTSVDSCVGSYVLLERACEAQMKAADARPLDDEAASRAHAVVGTEQAAWQAFQWLQRTHLPGSGE